MRATNAPARKKRTKRLLKRARGYRGSRHALKRMATETLLRAGNFAYRDRRVKKRSFRQLWIVRINAAARAAGTTYSQFMNGLKKAGIDLDRRQLSEMAIHDPATFASLVEMAKKAG